MIPRRFCVLLALFALSAQARGSVLIAHWTGASDERWNNPANWDIGQVPNNNGRDSFEVVWDAHPGTIISDTPVTIDHLEILVDGTLTGGGDMTVAGDLIWRLGTISGTGTTAVQGLATHDTGKINLEDRTITFGHGLDVAGGELRLDGGRITSPSQVTIHSTAELSGYGFVKEAVIAGALNPTARQLPNGEITWLAFDDLTLQIGAQIGFKIKGSEAGAFDKFSVNDHLSLRGKLQVTLDPSATILPTDGFEIISAGAGATVIGSFENVVFGNRLLTSDGVRAFTVTRLPSGSVLLSEYGSFSTTPISISMRSDVSYQFTSGGPPTVLDANAEVLAQAGITWDGGSLRVRFSDPAATSTIDLLFDPSSPLSVDGDWVSYNGTRFAKVTAPFFARQDETFLFNAAATLEEIQKLLRSIKISRTNVEEEVPFPDEPILVTLTDAASDRVDKTIIAHAPVLIGLEADPAELFLTHALMTGTEVLDIYGRFSNGARVPVGDLTVDVPSDCGALSAFPARSSIFVTATAPGGCALTVLHRGFDVQIPVLVLDDCIFNYLFFALTGFHPSTGRPDLSTLSDKAASSPGTISLATFHALESLMNQTTEGQRLTALYRTHSPELLTMALANQQLAQAEANLVLSFQPLVTALLLGKGNQPIVSQQMIDQVNAVWDQIASLASSDLKAAMETERTRLNRFQSIVSKPFSEWAGLLNVRSPVAPWIYISSPRRVGAAFNLQANGSALAGTLFRSPNALSDWHPVTGATRTVTGDSIEFTDPAAPLGAVFYQIRVVTQ